MKPTTQSRHHQPGEDPSLAVAPNAEDASLAADEEGIGEVARLRREAYTEQFGGDRTETNDDNSDLADVGAAPEQSGATKPKDQDAKAQSGPRNPSRKR